MKRFALILYSICICHSSFAQEIPAATEQGLESSSTQAETETEDDTYWQQLEQFSKHPLNLNTAEPDELKQLLLLNDLQIDNLLSYRNLLGKLVSIYELQAIPAWDIVTIKRLLPFISLSIPFVVKQESVTRFRGGDHLLLLRISQVLQKTTGAGFKGSPQRIMFRYKYAYKDLLQFGVTGDKDAGEQFFKGAQKAGFDFYSFHFFVRKLGRIRALALGDYTVNMGQGLMQWQGLAFKKSAEVTGIKRQSAVLSPYSSAGEFYFFRGAGITIHKNKIDATAFMSYRKLNANRLTDTISGEDNITSFLSSGNNRTVNEINDRKSISQLVVGGNLVYRQKKLQIGWNGVCYRYSLPIKKRDEPYNLYAVSGSSWFNYSMDYSYTYRNMHFFGEMAADKNFNRAFVNGLLISVDPRVDMAFLHRSINKAYQAMNGNAFTENTYPSNEHGLYAGITVRPAAGWKAGAYMDIYTFPWVKYQADAPSGGKDFVVQFTYTPTKQVEIYTRYRSEAKQANKPGGNSTVHTLEFISRQSWRTHLSYKISPAVTLRSRIEMNWYNKKGNNGENGFLFFFDYLYKPMLSRVSGAIRLQYFETDGYDSRIYAYENDVQYSYSIPANAGRGYRYYILMNTDAGKRLSFWFRWAQTIYTTKNNTPASSAAMDDTPVSDFKLQMRIFF